jgi:ABC-type polysaccharide/polyol phosphate export permease
LEAKIDYSLQTSRWRYQTALADMYDGFAERHIWLLLGWMEIKQRYVRSVLGPFWLTLNTLILVTAMGPLYGQLFGQPVGAYFTYLVTSIVSWGLVSALVNEACTTFTSNVGFIQQVKKPYSVYVLKLIWRNLLVFAHSFVAIVIIYIFFPPQFGWNTPAFLLGVVSLSVNGYWMAYLLGVICARYRDVPQIINSLIGVSFFITPIMWKVENLSPSRQWAAHINPFYHMIEVVRRPLIYNEIPWTSHLVLLGMAVVGYAIAIPFFAKFRGRLAYWL